LETLNNPNITVASRTLRPGINGNARSNYIWRRGSAIGAQWTRMSGRDNVMGNRTAVRHGRLCQVSARFLVGAPVLSAYPVFFRKRKTFYLNKSRN
jgi:hypothetical protein